MSRLLVGLLGVALLLANPAGATFPGSNGLIAAEGHGGGESNSSLWLVGATAKFVGFGFHPAWSPDGKKLAISEPHSIEIATVEGMRLTNRRVLVRQSSRTHWVGNPAWSGDGRYVVYEHGEPSQAADIYKIRVSDGQTFRLTHARPGWRNLDPAWSPDNTTIAYDLCNPNGSRCVLKLMNADGSHPHVLLSRPGTEVIRPKWSPDGRKLGMTVDVSFSEQAEILDLASHKLRPVPGDADLQFDAWAPDGRYVILDVAKDISGGCSDGLAITTESGHVVRYLPCGQVVAAADWQPLR